MGFAVGGEAPVDGQSVAGPVGGVWLGSRGGSHPGSNGVVGGGNSASVVGFFGRDDATQEVEGRLSGAIDHFVKVSRSYWNGLFRVTT